MSVNFFEEIRWQMNRQTDGKLKVLSDFIRDQCGVWQLWLKQTNRQCGGKKNMASWILRNLQIEGASSNANSIWIPYSSHSWILLSALVPAVTRKHTETGSCPAVLHQKNYLNKRDGLLAVQCLKELKLYSLERHCETYRILYTWKILCLMMVSKAT